MPEVRRFGITAGLIMTMLVSACSSGSGPAATPTTNESFRSAANQFAISAERALAGTVFEQVEPDELASLVVGLCEGFGVGAIPATVDGIGLAASVGDQEIIAEVLIVGVVQVCPDRAPVDLTGFYLDAVVGTAETAGALGALDEGDVVRAGPVACDVLKSDAGVEVALLSTVDSLFGVAVDDIDSLIGSIDGHQGVVAGAVLASAAAVLCPQYAAAVEAFMESL